tara:strand:- start:6004 stop:6639 length:636 start_codon:yes stop_codon:yes gene_type:complete
MIMYIPKHFADPNTAKAAEIIKTYPFAILMTSSSSGASPEVTHLPLLIRDTPSGPCLIGHVARANPHWKMFDGKTSAVAIFSGPDAYVSPTWYDTPEMVPTWNYAAVHVHGCPIAMDDMTAARAALADLVAAFESPETGNWSMDRLTEERIQRQLKAIVAFEMPIENIESKLKLSQNRSAADIKGVTGALMNSAHEGGRETARMMLDAQSG